MSKSFEFSRREQQIMNTVFVLGAATVNPVVEVNPDPPTAMAVRRMMHILEEKGHLNRRSISAALTTIALAIIAGIFVPIDMLRAADQVPADNSESASSTIETDDEQQEEPDSSKPRETNHPNDGTKLDPAALEGVWGGKQDGVQVELRFLWYSEHQEVQWQVLRKSSNIGAQMSVVMEPDGSAAKLVFRKGAEFEATQGRLSPGVADTLRLEIIPNPRLTAPGYPAVKNLVLKRLIGRNARLLPKSEAARPLFKQWQEHANGDGTIPAALPEQLGVSVKQFLKNNTDQKQSHELQVMLSPLLNTASGRIPPEEAVFMLDAVADISALPIQMILDGAVEGVIQKTDSRSPERDALRKFILESRLQWGETVNGLRAALSIRAAAPESKEEGERLDLYLAVQNDSDAAIHLHASAAAPNPRSIEIRGRGLTQATTRIEQPMPIDVVLKPGQITYVLMVEPAAKSSNRLDGTKFVGTVLGNTSETLIGAMTIEKAPDGAWTGNLITGETNGAAAAGWEPGPRDARALFKVWQENVRTNLKVPGALIGRLGAKVREFAAADTGGGSGNPYAEQFAPLIARFDASHDWSLADASELLDEVCAVSEGPCWFNMQDLKEQTIERGQPLPAEFSDAPWGPPAPNGLRAALLLEPRAEEYRIGTVLTSRVLIHNSGKVPVVIITRSWQKGADQARDATGANIKVDSLFWSTSSPAMILRLAPGEYFELQAPEVGLGIQDRDYDWQGRRIYEWIAAKVDDEVTFVPGAMMTLKGRTSPVEVTTSEEAPDLWQSIIRDRVQRELPLPPGARDREQILYRVVQQLFGADPTSEELTQFARDQSSDTQAALMTLLTNRPGVEPWVGMLQAGETKFRVLPADLDAAKKPRTTIGPGEYTLGTNATFVVTRKDEGLEGSIAFTLPDARHALKLPGGRLTWAGAWVRHSDLLWIIEKDIIRRIDFSDRDQVQETVFDGIEGPDTVPTPIREALRAALDGPDAPSLTFELLPKQSSSATDPHPAAEDHPAAEPVKGAKLQPATESMLEWGQPVNGLRMALAWPPTLDEPTMGEVSEFHAVVQNISDTPVRLWTDAEASERSWIDVRRRGVVARMTSGEPIGLDVTLQPQEVVFFRMYAADTSDASNAPVGATIASDIRRDPVMTLQAGLEIVNAPSGEWKGTLLSPDTRAGVGAEAPKN